MNMVALIPARAGSTRVPGKNMRFLGGLRVVDWTCLAAFESGVFSRVILATDESLASTFDMDIYRRAPVPNEQPDIVWVRDALLSMDERPDAFAILRPTSPFRTADTIRRAYAEFRQADSTADSIRAVEPVKQNPYKMWIWEGQGYPIKPLLSGEHRGVPLHSSPSQVAPPVYLQNSSLEMAWTSNVETYGTIHGRKVAPFFTQDYEGFSIDTEDDWDQAVRLVESGRVSLPCVGPRVGREAAAAPAQ